jgi:hypothetical protein
MPRPLEGPIDLLREADRMLSFGERAALEGVLAQARPGLAIEIGTAEGGTLARIAAHSREVHSFDLGSTAGQTRGLPNVTFHAGDSHVLLPKVLARLAEEGRNVDFVLVDGDHSAEGVRRDLVDLLESPAVARSLVLVHDTSNQGVRAGIEQVPFESYSKVAHVDLDFVGGYMFREAPFRNELWGGLGLVVVDEGRTGGGRVRQDRYYEAFELLREGGRAVADRDPAASGRSTEPVDRHELVTLREQLELLRGRLSQIEDAREELAQLEVWHRQVTTSLSWRVTAPLRALARALRHSRRSG